MKDENGNEIPMAVVEVYRLKRVSERRTWSRKHKVWCYVREYQLIGAVTADECERVLRLMFQHTPDRRITEVQFSPGLRTCWIYWQSAQ